MLDRCAPSRRPGPVAAAVGAGWRLCRPPPSVGRPGRCRGARSPPRAAAPPLRSLLLLRYVLPPSPCGGCRRWWLAAAPTATGRLPSARLPGHGHHVWGLGLHSFVPTCCVVDMDVLPSCSGAASLLQLSSGSAFVYLAHILQQTCIQIEECTSGDVLISLTMTRKDGHTGVLLFASGYMDRNDNQAVSTQAEAQIAVGVDSIASALQLLAIERQDDVARQRGSTNGPAASPLPRVPGRASIDPDGGGALDADSTADDLGDLGDLDMRLNNLLADDDPDEGGGYAGRNAGRDEENDVADAAAAPGVSELDGLAAAKDSLGDASARGAGTALDAVRAVDGAADGVARAEAQNKGGDNAVPVVGGGSMERNDVVSGGNCGDAGNGEGDAYSDRPPPVGVGNSARAGGPSRARSPLPAPRRSSSLSRAPCIYPLPSSFVLPGLTAPPKRIILPARRGVTKRDPPPALPSRCEIGEDVVEKTLNELAKSSGEEALGSSLKQFVTLYKFVLDSVVRRTRDDTAWQAKVSHSYLQLTPEVMRGLTVTYTMPGGMRMEQKSPMFRNMYCFKRYDALAIILVMKVRKDPFFLWLVFMFAEGARAPAEAPSSAKGGLGSLPKKKGTKRARNGLPGGAGDASGGAADAAPSDQGSAGPATPRAEAGPSPPVASVGASAGAPLAAARGPGEAPEGGSASGAPAAGAGGRRAADYGGAGPASAGHFGAGPGVGGLDNAGSVAPGQPLPFSRAGAETGAAGDVPFAPPPGLIDAGGGAAVGQADAVVRELGARLLMSDNRIVAWAELHPEFDEFHSSPLPNTVVAGFLRGVSPGCEDVEYPFGQDSAICLEKGFPSQRPVPLRDVAFSYKIAWPAASIGYVCYCCCPRGLLRQEQHFFLFLVVLWDLG